MTRPVLVIGATTLDIKGRLLAPVVDNSSNASAVKIGLGGVGRNIAENLARIGAPVVLLSVVGDDAAGRDMLANGRAVGMDVSRVYVAHGETTGLYLAALNQAGQMFIAMDDVRVLRHITCDYLHRNQDSFRHCDWIALDLNLSHDAFAEALRLARLYQKPVAVDPTSTDIAHRLIPHLAGMSLVTPNLDEACVLLGMTPGHHHLDTTEVVLLARRLVARGVETAIITHAEYGACYATAHEAGHFPAWQGGIVDTTGAGDALTAAVVFGLRAGMPVAESLKLGLRAAAMTMRSGHTVAQDLTLDNLYGLDPGES